MTRIRCGRFILVLVAALVLRASDGAAQSHATVTTQPGAIVERLVYVGDQSAAPWEYLTPDGQPAGFNVDLLREISRISGRHIEVRLGPWARMRQALDERQADLAILATSTSRRDRYDYLTFVWTRQQSAVFPMSRRTPPPTGLHDLAREVVAIEGKSVMQDLLAEVPEERRPALMPVTSPAEALRAVRSGAATLALGNQITLRRAARELGIDDVDSREVKAMAYFFVTSQGRLQEFDWLEPTLATLKEEGVLARLVERHLVERTASPRLSSTLVASGVAVAL
ncbi:MAG TPA: transporter substrate-binding domain-containing protein, partial [Luteitalea sp.]|nr:transporter substrate-binding domain-containing protein [Luteitalea sp.]